MTPPIELDPAHPPHPPAAVSLLEVVLHACDWSEDQTEIADLVDALVLDERIHVRRLLP